MSRRRRGERGLSARAIARLALVPAALLVLALPSAAAAEVQYGTLSNFDTFNDSGEETHGFEIELDGVSSSDVTYTFGAPYERYGNPVVENFAGGVYVRYESPYDPASKSFTVGTPVASSPIEPTLGHQCWTGGSVNYLTSGCEHFGLGLIANPTAVHYHWLVADPANPGKLKVSGTNVGVPAPEFVVKQPEAGGKQPVVEAGVKAPEADGVREYGEAQWVKVFVTESHEKAQLDNLLTDNPAVPQEASQTEVEWKLVQRRKPGTETPEEIKEREEEEKKEKAESKAARRAGVKGRRELGEGDESVTRRYEIYKYTGPIDPESGEAIPANEDKPAEGEVGEYVGAQMDAVNVEGGVEEAPPAVTKVAPTKGTAAGGATVKIYGAGFNNTTAVRFGTHEAASFKVNAAGTLITAVSPAQPGGTVDVTVITGHGASPVVTKDHYKVVPVVSGVAPAEGTKAGGATVTIKGAGFASGATVKFGAAKAKSVECLTETECTVTSPAHAAGVVDVTVSVAGAVSAKTAADHYTFG